jgi:hypothetical protein
MLNIEDLYFRRCVAGLVQLIEQVPCRLAARSPVALSNSSVAMLVLWTLLRWERTFLLIALEDMGVDMWGLTRDVDTLLDEEKANAVLAEGKSYAPATSLPALRPELDRYLEALLDRAELEALALQHQYLGTEHVLLAIIAGADARLSSVLTRYNITHENVKRAVVELLERSPALAQVVEAETPPSGPRGARWDRPAAGVPRRFGMAVLLLLVAMYAVLFGTMKMLDTHPIVFIVVAVLFTGVGLGQILLFEGKYPRAASIWVGACLFPLEVLGVLLAMVPAGARPADVVPALVLLLIFSVPLGAGFGYLAGGLTAGVFLLIEQYQKYRQDRQAT